MSHFFLVNQLEKGLHRRYTWAHDRPARRWEMSLLLSNVPDHPSVVNGTYAALTDLQEHVGLIAIDSNVNVSIACTGLLCICTRDKRCHLRRTLAMCMRMLA